VNQAGSIELIEYQPREFSRDTFTDAEGELIWQRYGDKVAVEFPSPKTGGLWRLTSQGWAGYLPLARERGIALRPRVDIANLFRMLEYAWRLKSFRFLEGLIGCDSLDDFYERLANLLAHRIDDRARRGFYRTYLSETEPLAFIRGRVDVRRATRIPWATRLTCCYEEHTGDIEDNQLLAWTIWRIVRSGICTERILPALRRTHRVLQGVASLVPFGAGDCLGRLYHRLNDDYEPLHALCRFFLANSGPAHETGDRMTVPFVVDMARLFELFVAEWLCAHSPPDHDIKPQYVVAIGNGTKFKIDIVLLEAATGTPLSVIDTKYKTTEMPAAEDIAQVVAYAEAIGCREAILLYPAMLKAPFNERVGDIRVRSLGFPLDDDLDAAGRDFVACCTAAL
jgi:5-methylcytosine-specific restriction enzyme subunit McrC